MKFYCDWLSDFSLTPLQPKALRRKTRCFLLVELFFSIISCGSFPPFAGFIVLKYPLVFVFIVGMSIVTSRFALIDGILAPKGTRKFLRGDYYIV